MPTVAEAKHERLQVRIDRQAKQVLQCATGHGHKMLSQFVLGSALEESERVIRENEVVTLSGADWKVFYDALTDPPAPNATLCKRMLGTGRLMDDLRGRPLAYYTSQ